MFEFHQSWYFAGFLLTHEKRLSLNRSHSIFWYNWVFLFLVNSALFLSICSAFPVVLHNYLTHLEIILVLVASYINSILIYFAYAQTWYTYLLRLLESIRVSSFGLTPFTSQSMQRGEINPRRTKSSCTTISLWYLSNT